MLKVILSAFVTVLLISSHSPAIARDYCAYKEESNAINVRAMRSMLMVAALSCNQQKEYNKFTKRFQGYLVSQQDLVNGYFGRVYGNSSRSRMTDFVTALANKSSQRSLNVSNSSFCKKSSKLFKSLNRGTNDRVIKIASKSQFRDLHNIRMCKRKRADEIMKNVDAAMANQALKKTPETKVAQNTVATPKLRSSFFSFKPKAEKASHVETVESATTAAEDDSIVDDWDLDEASSNSSSSPRSRFGWRNR